MTTPWRQGKKATALLTPRPVTLRIYTVALQPATATTLQKYATWGPDSGVSWRAWIKTADRGLGSPSGHDVCVATAKASMGRRRWWADSTVRPLPSPCPPAAGAGTPQGCETPFSRDWPFCWPRMHAATIKLAPCAKITASQIFTHGEVEGRAVDRAIGKEQKYLENIVSPYSRSSLKLPAGLPGTVFLARLETAPHSCL